VYEPEDKSPGNSSIVSNLNVLLDVFWCEMQVMLRSKTLPESNDGWLCVSLSAIHIQQNIGRQQSYDSSTH
jgi:hypothetical protein